jgi:hypothetical protein
VLSRDHRIHLWPQLHQVRAEAMKPFTPGFRGEHFSCLPHEDADGVLLVQENRGDDPRRDSDQKEVAVRLHPLIAAGRSAEAMAAPIIDNVLTASILGRQTIAAIEVMAIPALAPIWVASTLIALLLPPTISIGLIATTALAASALDRALRLLCTSAPLTPRLLSSPMFIASGLIRSNVLVLLGKSQTAETHWQRRNGANDGPAVHTASWGVLVSNQCDQKRSNPV